MKDEINWRVTNRVMKLDEFPNSVFYRVACDCSAGGHDITIMMEKDEKIDIVWVTFYVDAEWFYWHEGFWDWFVKRWKLLKASFRLFFTGFLEMQQEFVLSKPEHIDDFILALKEGKHHCLKNVQKSRKTSP